MTFQKGFFFLFLSALRLVLKKSGGSVFFHIHSSRDLLHILKSPGLLLPLPTLLASGKVGQHWPPAAAGAQQTRRHLFHQLPSGQLSSDGCGKQRLTQPPPSPGETRAVPRGRRGNGTGKMAENIMNTGRSWTRHGGARTQVSHYQSTDPSAQAQAFQQGSPTGVCRGQCLDNRLPLWVLGIEAFLELNSQTKIKILFLCKYSC